MKQRGMDWTAANFLLAASGAMIDREDSFAQRTLPIDGIPFETVLILLREHVERRSQGVLTVSRAVIGLLYDYVKRGNRAVVLCKAGAPEIVTERGEVLKAWFILPCGLLPAAFDHMPKAAIECVRAMDGA